MEPYRNCSGHSGVVGYEAREDGIVVCFIGGQCYLYDRNRPGPEHVANMLELAAAGEGLATYISRFVRERYARTVDR